MKLIKWLDQHFEEAILVILLVLISCVELIQVIVRNVPWIPALTWAEEFCRFCWIWSVFVSLPYTIRKASMLRVSVLVDALPGKMKTIMNIIVDFVTTIAMGYLGFYSTKVVANVVASGELSPAMRWPMWIIYLIMIVGLILGAIRGIQQIILRIMHFNDKTLSTREQTMKEAAEEVEAGRRAESLTTAAEGANAEGGQL